MAELAETRGGALSGEGSVLVLAGVLLGLGLLAEHAFPARPRPGPGADPALEILVGAKGRMLPSARLGSGPELVGEVIRIGDVTLAPARGREGLRAAAWKAQQGLVAQRTFALAENAEEALALAAHVRASDEGTLLVLASSGSVELPDERARRALAAVLEALGARAAPGGRAVESWALIALRREEGWAALAEGYSEDSGVALVLALPTDLSRSPAFSGEFLEGRAPRETEILLQEELALAHVRTPGIELARDALVATRRLPAIRMRLTPERRRSVVSWSRVALGPGSGVLAWVGIEDGSGACPITFELRVDGQPTKALTIHPRDPWHVLEVDLRPFAGRSVELELVAVAEDARPAVALWGVPVLFHGYTDPPRKTWFERR